MIDLTKWKVGSNYNYEDLQALQDNEEHSSVEYGEFVLGEQFIVIKDDHDRTLSFMLTGYFDPIGGIFKLIFKG